MKTIGIDARFYGSKSRGLGRYTVMLLKYLEKVDKTNHYLVYLRRENFNNYRPKNPNFQKKIADVGWYSLKEQLLSPFIFDQKKIDLMHFPHFNVPLLYRRPFVVTIHDLILMEHPTQKATQLGPLRYKIKEIGYKLVLRKAILASRKIITVSHFTKKDIIKHFPKARSKIQVIYEASKNSPAACENLPKGLKLKQNQPEKRKKKILKKYGIVKPYLLYVGAAYPHKNLENLVLAFQKLKKDPALKTQWDKLSLVLAGGSDYFYQRVKKFVQQHSISGIKFLGLVKKESHLKTLYRNATLFVFPSLYEGFGLPPLEAMAQDTPVVSSSTGSLPEVLKKAAYYFNPHQVSDIAEKIKKVLLNSRLQKKIILRGRKRIQHFSWEKTGRQTLKVYHEALKQKSS